jgi:hypothetical protein
MAMTGIEEMIAIEEMTGMTGMIAMIDIATRPPVSKAIATE